jgi:hypothetical protein
MEEFEKGDIVYHKTNGSLPMVVIESSPDKIKCRWSESLKVKYNGFEIKEFEFISEELTKDMNNTSANGTFF